MNASLKPLPNKLNEIMSNEITIAGKTMRYGSEVITPCPSLSNVPKDVVVVKLRLIIPKYVNVDSEKITLGIIRTVDVTSVPAALGRMCLKISRLSFAPRVRDARTYS